MKNTTPVYETFSMDFTSRIEHARRADGRWFRRIQYRSPYGYKWTAWTAEPEFEALRDSHVETIDLVLADVRAALHALDRGDAAGAKRELRQSARWLRDVKATLEGKKVPRRAPRCSSRGPKFVLPADEK